MRIPAAHAHTVLVRGFGLPLLYGGIGLWLLAGLSHAIFSRRRAALAAEGVD